MGQWVRLQADSDAWSTQIHRSPLQVRQSTFPYGEQSMGSTGGGVGTPFPKISGSRGRRGTRTSSTSGLEITFTAYINTRAVQETFDFSDLLLACLACLCLSCSSCLSCFSACPVGSRETSESAGPSVRQMSFICTAAGLAFHTLRHRLITPCHAM